MQDPATKGHLRRCHLRDSDAADAPVGARRAARALEPLRRVFQRRGSCVWATNKHGHGLIFLDRDVIYPRTHLKTPEHQQQPTQVVGDDPLPTDRSVLYAVIPHGTFPFGLGVVREACLRTACLFVLPLGF